MRNREDKFARLLTEGIYQIRLREHKNIAIVQDEVGYAIGREGGSPIEYWRKGHIPKEREEIELLAQELVERGKLDRPWLVGFLDAADYILPEPFIQELFPESDPSQDEADQTRLMLAVKPVYKNAGVPSPPNQLVGRKDELAEIAKLISDYDEDSCRLVTLLGPGGIGKTRLSVEVARQLQDGDRFPDGVVFIPLASISTIDAVPGALASGLSLPLNTAQNVNEQLLSYLQSLNMLMVIDNFDQFVEAGATFVSDLLQQTTKLKIIVTSRERLNIRWEHVYSLRGLAVDDPSPTAVAASEAATFFKNCVLRVKPGTDFSAEDERAIDVISQSVEGFPLALELAASWANILSCAEIAAEITQNLDILSTSQLDIPQRHRSLRAVCEYSIQVLEPAEQVIFKQLSLFLGGFTRQAAAQITGASLTTLSRFVNKSLLVTAGRNRFDLHQILAQYASDLLVQEDALYQKTLETYSHYFCQRLKEIAPAIYKFDHRAMLAEIGRDLEDFRQAWRWAAEHDRFDLIDLAADGLYLYYQMASRFQEGEIEFRYALDHLPPNSLTRARLLNRIGHFLFRLMRIDEAVARLEESAAIHRTLNETVELPMANTFLAVCASMTRNFTQGLPYLRENETLQADRDNPAFYASTQNNLGRILGALGEREASQAAFQAAEKTIREIDQAWGIAVFYNFRGDTSFEAKEFGDAERYYREAAATYAELYYDIGTCATRALVGECLLYQGEIGAAERELREALVLALETHAVFVVLRCLQAFAKLPADRVEPELGYAIASLVSAHPAAEIDVRQAAHDLLAGRPPLPSAKRYGERLNELVAMILET